MAHEEGTRHLRYINDAFEEYLAVNISITNNEQANKDFPIALVFTITNEAPYSNIVFEEIHLRIGEPPYVREETIKELASKQSVEYTHNCSYSDLIDLRYDVDGSISPQHFFEVTKTTQMIRVPQANLSPIVYITAVNEMMIHKCLQDTLRNRLVPGPDTTLAQIEAQKDILKNASIEISAIIARIDKMKQFIDLRNPAIREILVPFDNMIKTYLEKTKSKCLNCRDSLSDTRLRTRLGLEDLTTEASKINQTTEELMEKYSLSDENANYSYRNWQ